MAGRQGGTVYQYTYIRTLDRGDYNKSKNREIGLAGALGRERHIEEGKNDGTVRS